MNEYSRREFLKLLGGAAAASFVAPYAFAEAAAVRGKIAIVTPVNACAAGERPFALRVAKHLKRWIGKNGILADIETDTNLAAALKNRKLALLVMCQTPDDAEIRQLAAFVQNGGKIVSFYGTSAKLASLMGVRLGKYVKPAPGTFAEIVFAKDAKGNVPGLPHAPVRIVQSSANIFQAYPVEKKSTAIAYWHNRKGVNTKEPAVLQSGAGWWVTHILTADGDEKAKELLLLSMIGASVPGAWAATAWRKKLEERNAAERAYAAKQKPRKGEIHAVWEQSGEGLYPGDWPRTMKELAAMHITDLYVNVCGPAFAHYPSKVLPASQVLAKAGNQLAAALTAAKGTGVRVHAWMMCFAAERAAKETIATFSEKKWLIVDAAGKELRYLDPSNPEVRAYLLKAMIELVAKYPVDGLHLDFIRWPAPADLTRTTPGAMARFKASKLADTKDNFAKWRVRQLETFLAAARTRVKAIRPAIQFSAAVLGAYKGAYASMGQDWKAWMDKGLVDKIVPMNYTEKDSEFAAWIAEQGSTDARAKKVIAGIGVTANESRLTARQVTDQILIARRAKLVGVAYFDLDYMLMHDILPVLRAGVI